LEQDKEEDGFAHPAGKRPRKEPLFGGALQKMETGAEFGFSRTLDDRCPGLSDRTRDAANDYDSRHCVGDHFEYADRKSRRHRGFRIWMAYAVIESAGEPEFAIGLISSPRWEQDTEQQRRPANDRVPGNKTER
jgi:hypothetical protein